MEKLKGVQNSHPSSFSNSIFDSRSSRWRQFLSIRHHTPHPRPHLTVLKHLISALQNVILIPIREGTCSGFPSSYNTAYSCVATDKLLQLIVQFNATTLKTVVANSSSRMLTRIAAFKPAHLEANDTLVETQAAFNTTICSLSGHGSSLFKL